jgi:hypothetical protein
MKLKLALVLAVLSLAGVARADSITVGELPLIIPDGSTVTATGVEVAPWGDTYYVADYTFSDGAHASPAAPAPRKQSGASQSQGGGK